MKGYSLSGSSEYRHEDRCFKRVSSDAEWEWRLRPPEPWSRVIMNTVCALAAVYILYLACWRL